MNKITNQIQNFESLIQFVEDHINKTELNRIEEEIRKLDIKNLIDAENQIDLDVLISNTEKYPILNDYLEKYFKKWNFGLDRYLRYACFEYIKGLTNIKTIEILLKLGENNRILPNCSNLLSRIFDKESSSEEKYKIVGDLLFSHGYDPNYDIFTIEAVEFRHCCFDEREVGFIDYCIQKIPKNTIKIMINEIVNDRNKLYEEEYKAYLLNKFFKSYPYLLMEMLKK